MDDLEIHCFIPHREPQSTETGIILYRNNTLLIRYPLQRVLKPLNVEKETIGEYDYH